MKSLLKYITIVLMVNCSLTAFGQQEPQFTQFMDNMLYYNPAYAGSREMMNITAIHRQQWAGFKGAPMTTGFSLHSPLRYESLGLGLSVMNDRVGPTNSGWINADFSYAIRFKNNKGRLSFGLKGGLNILNGDFMSLVRTDNADQSVNFEYKNEIRPNIGAGVYYRSDRWFAGFSMPKIFDYSKSDKYSEVAFTQQRHYYFTVGGYINASRMLKIRPSTMLKVTDNAPLAWDVNAAFIFYDKLWLGANYRILESAGVYFQYQFNNRFKVGYAFEMSQHKLRRYNAGTHELLLSYDLLFKSKSLSNPRYF